MAYEHAWDRLDFSTLWNLSGPNLRDGRTRDQFVRDKLAAYHGEGRGLSALVRSVRNAAAFREVSGMGWREMLRQGREMRRGGGLSWGQVLMAANTPVLLRAAMVDGRTDLGLMSSGQVAGLIDDLPSCAELIESIMAEAGRTLDRLDGIRKA